MKTFVLGLTTLALAGATVSTASARDREWATAGKILTGLAAVSLVARAFEGPPACATPQVVYVPACPPPVPVVVYSPPVCVSPEPVVVYQQSVYGRPAPCYRGRPVVVVESGFRHEHRYGHTPVHHYYR